MSGHHRNRNRRRTSRSALVWVACGFSALLLVLSTNGTLSSWTAAVIGNDTNTVATATAVILQEVGPSATCLSSSGVGNSFTCSTINKYGGVTTPLTPGANQVTDVVFSNVGSSAASSFVLTRGTCTQNPTAGSGSPAANNICTNGELTVAISCSDGATYNAGTAWSDLKYVAGAPASIGATLTHTATIAASASFTCRFTVALDSAASVLDQGITASQPLTWTLNK
ncbi:MAG: hypothetical protein JWQ32_417 [Marmoricola sp.]|nr:hypothetical protein [Marmoricola sp.]